MTSPDDAPRAAPWVRAELVAAAWEIFSALLFVSAILPAAFASAWPALLFAASMALLPPLALFGTLGFTVAVRPATKRLVVALEAGPEGDRAVLLAGLRQAESLPAVLAYINFGIWFACTSVGVFYFRTG